MSAERLTPMQELHSIVKELKSIGKDVDTNGLEDWITSVGLGKEKQHFKSQQSEKEKELYQALRALNRFDLDDRGSVEYCEDGSLISAKELLQTLEKYKPKK